MLLVACDPGFNAWRCRWVYQDRVCTSVGDCDDQCPARCPDLEEVCDGLDNDCSYADLDPESRSDSGPGSLDGVARDTEEMASTLVADNGIPASMLSGQGVAGTVSIDEIDLDQDGFLSCSTFSADSLQVHQTAASCDVQVLDPLLGEDCNNLCALTNPGATERCNGFLDVCLAEAEGTDLDFDDLRSCGAWSAPGSDEKPGGHASQYGCPGKRWNSFMPHSRQPSAVCALPAKHVEEVHSDMPPAYEY